MVKFTVWGMTAAAAVAWRVHKLLSSVVFRLLLPWLLPRLLMLMMILVRVVLLPVLVLLLLLLLLLLPPYAYILCFIPCEYCVRRCTFAW